MVIVQTPIQETSARNEEHPDFRLAATADGKVFADNGGFADSQIWKFDAFAENGYYLHN